VFALIPQGRTQQKPWRGHVGVPANAKKKHKKNAQVVTDLQTSCNKVVVDIWMCSHCLFPVVVTSLEQVVIITLSQD
jgi:hypothetical protein